MRHLTFVAMLTVLALAAAPALAGRGGNGNGHWNEQVAGSCTVEDNAVHATGLPTDEVVNFLVTDANGTWGWVLGFTDLGTWSVPIPAHDGPATYEFVSRTWGPNGSKYDVFASCSD